MRREHLESTGGRTWSRRIMRAAAVTLAVGVVGLASPASAHVTVTPSTTTPGAHAILEFGVGHGCEKSSTTRITIQIPPQITSVTPTRTALWKVEKQTEKVDPPVTDAHGNSVVERVASITYSTDTPLPDGYREVFDVEVQLPTAGGTTLSFPTIQTCEQGETAWIEVPQDGQNTEKLARPAPGFVVSAPGFVASGSTHHAATGPAPAPAPETDGITLAALVAGIVGSVLGGAALFRQRPRP